MTMPARQLVQEPAATVAAHRPARTAMGKAMLNAMSVDVEDYFQVQAFADTIDRRDWDRLPCRVERNVDRLLGMFDAAGVKWISDHPRVRQ